MNTTISVTLRGFGVDRRYRWKGSPEVVESKTGFEVIVHLTPETGKLWAEVHGADHSFQVLEMSELCRFGYDADTVSADLTSRATRIGSGGDTCLNCRFRSAAMGCCNWGISHNADPMFEDEPVALYCDRWGAK